ncbi:MAG: glycosyltransferase [Verrucomicrobiota bacterium]
MKRNIDILLESPRLNPGKAGFVYLMSTPANMDGKSCGGHTPTLDLLIINNGTLANRSESIGGGDQVVMKIIRLSGLKPDLLVPRSAVSFVAAHRRLYLTMGNLPLNLIGLIILFLVRIFQGSVKGLFNRHCYDVALGVSPYSVDLIPLWFWKARRKGTIIYHVIPERKAVNWATRLRFAVAGLEQRVTAAILSRTCDFIVAGNAITQAQLQKKFPGKQVVILHAGFNAATLDAVPDSAKDRNLACFVGRLVSQKGIFDLLQVMAVLQVSDPAFRLIMVGTGPEREFFELEMHRLGLRNITLAGFLSESEKVALMKKAGFFFFPSYEEGWGIALAEALYCQCQCVCYELPHYRAIFSTYPAYAKLGQPQDFVTAFRQVQHQPTASGQQDFLRQYDDPNIVSQMVGHLETIAKP